MPRLRMKDTPLDIDAAVLKAERRAKRKRRDRPAPTREESMTPPRASTSKLPVDDFDESSIPPSQAWKRDEEHFHESLREAEMEDQGVGYYEELLYQREAAAFSYGGAAGVALGKQGVGVGVTGGMDEEEYAEYVRAGMWRRKNKEEVERREAIERERKIREEREQVENEKRNREERERIRKLEERTKRRNKEEEKEARDRYADKWIKLLAAPPPTPVPTPPPAPTSTDVEPGPQPAAPHPYPLRYTDFPWPLYPPAPFPPLSWPTPSLITPTSLTTFLLSHLPSDQKKAALKKAVLAYHPDRFERLLGRIPEEKEETRERVRELGLRVSQTLNDLMKAGGGN